MSVGTHSTLRSRARLTYRLLRLHTDNAQTYIPIGWAAEQHESVNHTMSEYVRGDVTTNHAEGYPQLKRSLDGTRHAVSREHLHRYLVQFDYLYSTRKMSDTQQIARLMGRLAAAD